ncbi:WXG100 family type VII secretion target [Paenibacillus sp. W4I10]|uniref:WXG100 family type VII secretion target n=1 Tax=Paenibacillus sp. W4I10 TaxID=3042298 RepID=UPI002788556E|nr:WXG100 family type VII secretion target [Paenibacillus sp. W4I10]MDQ0719222.1 WXG100 family type VII secretion target [Paenibacillus sp. W4I10]
MSTIKVTPEQLHNVSNQIDQARHQLEHIREDLSRQIMFLQQMWLGVTQERFYYEFEQSRPVLQKALESMVGISKELKDIAMRFENADAQKVSLGNAVGTVGAVAMMETSRYYAGSDDKGYGMAQVNVFGKWMSMPVNENGVTDQSALQAYERDQGHLDINRMQAVTAEPSGEDIFAMQIKGFEMGIDPFTGEPVSDKYAQMMLTSLKFSQLFMAFQMVRGSMPGGKGPFRLPSSHPAVAKIKKNLEAAEARKANEQKSGSGVTGQASNIGEVKLKPLGTKGEGDALKRTFEIDGTKVEINSGHGYRGSGHRTGNAQDIGTMDQIESVILKDMELANKANIDFPRPPKTIERTIQVNEKPMGYTVTQTPDGTLRVSTYYPK